jgi:hypothetical protein
LVDGYQGLVSSLIVRSLFNDTIIGLISNLL